MNTSAAMMAEEVSDWDRKVVARARELLIEEDPRVARVEFRITGVFPGGYRISVDGKPEDVAVVSINAIGMIFRPFMRKAAADVGGERAEVMLMGDYWPTVDFGRVWTAPTVPTSGEEPAPAVQPISALGSPSRVSPPTHGEPGPSNPPIADPRNPARPMGRRVEDVVNHPAHYNTGGVEVIDAIEAWGLDFNRGNAVKYIARAGKKDPAKEREDLEKARWYLDRALSKLPR